MSARSSIEAPASVGAPRPPFEAWPVQGWDPDFGFLWYLPRGVALVTQFVHDRATPARVHCLEDHVEALVRARQEEIDRAGGLTFVHDWRSMRTYEPGSRQAMVARVQRRGTGYIKRSFFALADRPLVRLGSTLLNASNTLGIADGIRVVRDLETTLAELGLCSPEPDATWPV